MSPAKAALQSAPDATLPRTDTAQVVPSRLPNVRAGSGTDRHAGLRSVSPPATTLKQNELQFQPRVPVITGEVTYRGYLPVDGVISGQLSGSGGGLTIKQRPRNGYVDSEPELDGEISFKDILRVNGHVRGKVVSERGKLIVDSAATVDAFIDVRVAVISGRVRGVVVGRERVELGPCAIIDGKISTPSLTIKPGATFHGECRMLRTDN